MRKNKSYYWFSLLFFLLAVQLVIAQQTEKFYLSGDGVKKKVQWEFFCTAGSNSNKWTTITVPSCWELQGFGKYDYGFAKDSIRGKEQGFYKYYFDVPLQWKNKSINIVFEGVMTDAEVKINGKPAGAIHQGAYYTFKYDISKLLLPGTKNLLEVKCDKHSSNASVNDAERKADFWIFGGIFRPVYLEILPETHFTQIAVHATADGIFKAAVSTNYPELNKQVTVKIYDANGKLFSAENSVPTNPKFYDAFIFGKNCTTPKLWNPENPYLYTAVFSLAVNGKIVHTVSQKFGFRTIQVKKRDGIYLNGVKLKLKGVNRSPFRPETGRTLTKQQSIEDVLLIKEMNMNAVRCSHYPPDGHFLDACDSLGLLVIDELAGWHGYYNTVTGIKLIKEMMATDANHPSIILWANGNEGGHNLQLDKEIWEEDYQGRIVIHPWELWEGIETQHYREYNYGIGNYENGHEIIMPTEFLHGQFDGGHGAGLEDYWEKMWNDPQHAGGFLWDFSDQAVVRKDKKDSLDTDKFRAADGIVGPHHEKEGSFFAIKEIWSPVHLITRQIPYEFDGSIELENRYLFTNTKTCSFRYTLKTIGNFSNQISGSIPSPDLLPLQKGKIKIALPKKWYDWDVLDIEVKDLSGKNILTKSFAITSPAKYAKSIVLEEGYSRPTLQETDAVFILKANTTEIAIDKKTGLLVLVKNELGEIPFHHGPVLQEGNNNFQGFAVEQNEKTISIVSKFDKKSAYNTLAWTIYPTGIVKMEIQYFPESYFTNFVGVNFSFSENKLEGVDYFGNGPYRVWKNRLSGGTLDIWHKKYNSTETGESWDYPEFKGYYSKMYWCKFLAGKQSFLVATETEDLFLRLFTPAWKTDQWHNYEPLFPNGNISFMQAIPSIGSKTQRNETTGPMGMKNIFYDYEKDPARALQIILYFNFNN